MEISYYAGCSLHGLAAEYDESVRMVCRALGVELRELADWNCCGATSASQADDELALRLSARNMLIAERAGRELLVPCAACFQRLKRADRALKKDPARFRAPAYAGRAAIFHINDFFAQPEMLARVGARVIRPLAGLKVVAYYGCLSQRPPAVTGAATPDDPRTMDHLLEKLGATVLPWSFKTDCCGGSLAVPRPDILLHLSGRLLAAARDAGADCLVTDCPMCQSNLDTRQEQLALEVNERFDLPIVYLTELMALAFGETNLARWWKKHFVDPAARLARWAAPVTEGRP